MEAGARRPVGADRSAGCDSEQPRIAADLGRLIHMATEKQEATKLEQLSHATPDEIEVAAGRERENLEGWIPALATDGEIREALEKAFDYRGDVTLRLKQGEVIEGYIFDRRTGSSLE